MTSLSGPVVGRVGVDRGVRVVEVRGPAVQRAGDDVGAVALGLEERDRLRDPRAQERGGRGDPEARRARAPTRTR